MSTYAEMRMDKLAKKLKSRTQRDGKPLPGYAESVAVIKAEMAQLSIAPQQEDGDGD